MKCAGNLEGSTSLHRTYLKYRPLSLCTRGRNSSSIARDAEAPFPLLPRENGHSRAIMFLGSAVTEETSSTSTKAQARLSRFLECRSSVAYASRARQRTLTMQFTARPAGPSSSLHPFSNFDLRKKQSFSRSSGVLIESAETLGILTTRILTTTPLRFSQSQLRLKIGE